MCIWPPPSLGNHWGSFRVHAVGLVENIWDISICNIVSWLYPAEGTSKINFHFMHMQELYKWEWYIVWQCTLIHEAKISNDIPCESPNEQPCPLWSHLPTAISCLWAYSNNFQSVVFLEIICVLFLGVHLSLVQSHLCLSCDLTQGMTPSQGTACRTVGPGGRGIAPAGECAARHHSEEEGFSSSAPKQYLQSSAVYQDFRVLIMLN